MITVHRLEVTVRHAFVAFIIIACVLTGINVAYVLSLQRAETRSRALVVQTARQRLRLQALDTQAAALARDVRALQHRNLEIERLVGGRTRTRASTRRKERPLADGYAAVAARIARIRAASRGLEGEDARLKLVVARVLDLRRARVQARTRILAAIPSINPAGEAVAIRSPYGWRVDPWPEFHKGVDLDVNYGDPVRAAAAGTVVAAGYDGGFGIKVDIDHGNGYHTWYCHLSRADVRAGQVVLKGERIAHVGSTGVSTGPHLHYQVVLGGRAIDPTPYLLGIPPHVLASIR